MKKIIGAVVGFGLVSVLLYFGLQTRSDEPSSPKPTLDISGLKGPANNEEALYEVTLKTTQRTNAVESEVMSVVGTIAQSRQGDRDFITEWREITEFEILDKPADPQLVTNLLGKPVISVNNKGTIEHFLPKDFPATFMTFQLSLLNKLFVPVFGNSNNPIQATEKDEVGTAKIQYDFIEEGQNIKVLRTIERYVQDQVKADAEDNFLSFAYTTEKRLIQVKGKLTAHFREPSSIHMSNDIKVVYKGPAPQEKLTSSTPTKEEMAKTDINRAAALAQVSSRPADAMTFEEAMKKIDAITESTEGSEVYEIFTFLKDDITAHPERGAEVVKKISDIKDRSESGQRKLALLFGALAQSSAAEHSDSLVKLATDCPDEFCKTQAMVALNDHSNPTPESAKRILEIASQETDPQLAGTALLAAGAVGKKIQDSSAISQELLKEINDPAKAPVKNTVIAAMGNHGAADYFSPLVESLKSKDVSTRSSAAYSMRYLPNAEVNGTLIGLMNDPEYDVQREAVKAMAYRNLSTDEYQTVAQSAAKNPDTDLQQEAARVLIAAYRDNPKANQAPLETLLKETKSEDIKTFISAEMKSIAEAAAEAAAAAEAQKNAKP